MNSFRIALANLRFPASREESGALAVGAIEEASVAGAGLVAFPECFVPGYRAAGKGASFHEKAVLCRAAENTCYVATVNVASAGSPTTSAVARPDGNLLAYQPYGKHGVLIVDIDLATATGLLASRCKAGTYA